MVKCPNCETELNVTLAKSGAEKKQYYDDPKGNQVTGSKIDDIKARLVEDCGEPVMDLLKITTGIDRVIIQAKEFIKNKATWGEINSVVKSLDGEWIADGPNSRWEVKQ